MLGDRRLRIPALRHLAEGDQLVAGGHADRLRGEVEARPLPVADDVLEVDGRLADVVLLRGGEELEDPLRVVRSQRAAGQPRWEVHGRRLRRRSLGP
jgi:hypothetical protein